jgi:hypothetical protein
MKVYLDKTPVTAIKASLPKGPAIGPGQKLPLVATVTEPNGKILQTEGAGQGKVMWKDLKVTATIAHGQPKRHHLSSQRSQNQRRQDSACDDHGP